MISVLLVDPYDDSREAYATVLQSQGFRVHADRQHRRCV